jgi:hypothetical protein
LQQRSPQQPFGWDRGPPDGAVEKVELGIHAVEEATRQDQDPSDKSA